MTKNTYVKINSINIGFCRYGGKGDIITIWIQLSFFFSFAKKIFFVFLGFFSFQKTKKISIFIFNSSTKSWSNKLDKIIDLQKKKHNFKNFEQIDIKQKNFILKAMKIGQSKIFSQFFLIPNILFLEESSNFKEIRKRDIWVKFCGEVLK